MCIKSVNLNWNYIEDILNQDYIPFVFLNYSVDFGEDGKLMLLYLTLI